MPIDPGSPAAAEFARLVGASLGRYLRQNSLPLLAVSEAEALGARLWALIVERGLPAPLGPEERGAPGEIPEADCSALVGRLLAGVGPSAREALAVPARQLVKACFNPPFRDCRNSYREVSPDGSCRRQELARTRKRISGAHCVDCPYWLELEPAGHQEFLAAAWQPGRREEFLSHRELFLPEDFRALRRLLARSA